VSQPLVSVVVPAYQAARYITAALTSIRQQDLPGEVGVIVVDDGSTDGTDRVVATTDPRAQVLQRSNGGPAAARNTGVAAAAGEYVTFLDADDLWPPDSLRRRLAHLQANPQAAGVMGRTVVFAGDTDGPTSADEEHFGPPVYGAFLGATLLRRHALERAGGFDETLRVGEDYDLLARVRELGAPLLLMDEVCNWHRRHDRNLTLGVQRDTSNILQVVKASLDRRRAQGGHASPLPSFGDDTSDAS